MKCHHKTQCDEFDRKAGVINRAHWSCFRRFPCSRKQQCSVFLAEICSQFSQADPEESVPKEITFRADFVPLHGL